MTTTILNPVQEFQIADQLVNELENKLNYTNDYVPTMIEDSIYSLYESALNESTKLYNDLVKNDIDPFA